MGRPDHTTAALNTDKWHHFCNIFRHAHFQHSFTVSSLHLDVVSCLFKCTALQPWAFLDLNPSLRFFFGYLWFVSVNWRQCNVWLCWGGSWPSLGDSISVAVNLALQWMLLIPKPYFPLEDSTFSAGQVGKVISRRKKYFTLALYI